MTADCQPALFYEGYLKASKRMYNFILAYSKCHFSLYKYTVLTIFQILTNNIINIKQCILNNYLDSLNF